MESFWAFYGMILGFLWNDFGPLHNITGGGGRGRGKKMDGAEGRGQREGVGLTKIL